MQSHKNIKLTKNASFDPFTSGGGGGGFEIKIKKFKDKRVVTLGSLEERSSTRA
jgi:hypothetical protein